MLAAVVTANPFFGPVDSQERPQKQHGDRAAEPHDIPGECDVPFGIGIVVEAVQDNPIDRRTDLAIGGFEQTQTQIACLVLKSVQIPGTSPPGGRTA